MRRIIFAAVVGLFMSAAHAEEIPLKSVWTLDQPGTKDIRELEPKLYPDTAKRKFEKSDKSLAIKFLKTKDRLTKDKPADEGFAVSGDGLDALKHLEPSDKLPAGKPVSLVFFTHSTGRPIFVQQVERDEQKITLRYEVGDRNTFFQSQHLALIPLGKLPPGQYDVEITPQKEEPATRNVCKSFSFNVEEP